MNRARQLKGLTTRQLADISGLSQSFVVQVEGGNNCTVESLLVLAKALGVKASYLLGEK